MPFSLAAPLNPFESLLDVASTVERLPLTQETFRYRLVVPDRKNSAKDMAFSTTDSFDTAAQARENAALLALLKLQTDQPLERKLPEPYK